MHPAFRVPSSKERVQSCLKLINNLTESDDIEAQINAIESADLKLALYMGVLRSKKPLIGRNLSHLLQTVFPMCAEDSDKLSAALQILLLYLGNKRRAVGGFFLYLLIDC